jgi:uncharacterized membrane protein YqgA involved in biofilm formation
MAITINIPDLGQVTIPEKFTWATEETQLRIEKLLDPDKRTDPVKDAIDADGTKPGSFGSGLKKSAKDFLMSSDAQAKLSQEIQFAGDRTIGFTKSLLQGERGFSSLNPVIDAISSAFVGLAEKIPFIGGVLGGTIGAIAQIRQELNAILDTFMTQFDTFSQAGLEASVDIRELQIAAREGRIGLETLIGATTQASGGLIALEGNFTRGVNRFLEIQQAVLGMEENLLEKLGLNVEDQATFISEFLQSQRNNAILSKLSQDELNKVIFENAKNFRVLAEFTGMDIQSQKEAMIANAADMALQARLLELSNSNRAEEAARIQNFLALLRDADPSGIITQRFKEEFSVFGGVVTEQSGVLEQILQRANVDVDDIAKQVQKGTIDNATAIANILGAANEALSQDTTFLAQLSMIDGAAGTVSTVAQGLIEALGQFVNQDVAANAERARTNIDTTNQNISDFGKELVDGRVAIQTALSELESALLDSAEKLIGIGLKSNKKLAEGLSDIIEGASIGDIELIRAGMVTVIGESIVPSGFLEAVLGDFYNKAGDMGIVVPNDVQENFLGGNVQAGDFSMVGEQGPELVRFGRAGEVINNATSQDIMGAANQVANNIGNNNVNANDYSQQTLDVLTAMAREQSDTKRLLQKILPKAMASNGYF